jgi:CDP-4-dehydro-6-deoxyglucose reductase
MSFRVRLLPADTSFEIGRHETVLGAALRAGSNVNYGCSNGNCGLCRARLISGGLHELQHFDFHLSAADRAAGYFLMCAHGAASDLEIEAAEARDVTEIPHQELDAKVRRVERVSENVTVLRLRSPRTRRLRFLAGQRAWIGASPEVGADLSIASCPCDDLHLEFHVPRCAAAPFTQQVFEQLKPGDPLLVRGPQGSFVIDEKSDRPLLMIAIWAGFAPIKSLIEHAIALDEERRICLVWLGLEGYPRYMGNLCRSWADALDDFAYLPVDIPAPSSASSGIDQGLVRGLESALSGCADPTERDAYAAGPPDMLPVIARALQDLGIPADRIRVERLQAS